ncbi:recombinase family protein [Embleya sp. NPDC001921]
MEDPVAFEDAAGTSSRLHPLQRPKFAELLVYARPGDTVHIPEMFRLVRGTGHILDVLDVLHRDRLALRIHDGAFSAMDLTARHPRTANCCPPCSTWCRPSPHLRQGVATVAAVLRAAAPARRRRRPPFARRVRRVGAARGRSNGTGYAPSSASTILAAFVVGLRERGVHVTRDDQAEARKALDGLTVRLLQDGQRRGRGQAKGVNAGDLYTVVGLLRHPHRASRPRADPRRTALRLPHPGPRRSPRPRRRPPPARPGRGHPHRQDAQSVRDARILRQRDPEICPVRAW